MSTEIINDAKLHMSAEKVQANDRFGNDQLQPNSKDWIEITSPAYSPGSILTESDITFTDPMFNASETFKIGDKLRLIVNTDTDYSYFYIIAATESSITVVGGTDYVVDNANISKLAYSRLKNPVGHPIRFNTTIDDTVVTASVMTIGSTSGVSQFWMEGNSVFYTGYLDTTTSGSAGIYVFVILPFGNPDTTFPNVATLTPGIIVNEGTPNQAIKVELNLVGYEEQIAFSKLDGSNMVVGGVFLQWSVFYLIQ